MALLNSLSARRYCSFVAQLTAKLGIKFSRTQNLIAKIKSDSRFSEDRLAHRRACRRWKSRVSNFRKLFNLKGSKKSLTMKGERMDIIKSELPSVFNNLPLPFQCEVLFEVGRKSVFKPEEDSENSVNSVTKMNVYEVGNIIKKSEKTLIEDISIVRVADRCVKVLAGKKYRTTDVIISVELGNYHLKQWKQGFRAKMQWIMGTFAKNNGIKLENLHNLTAKHNLPFSAYFTHLLNTSKTGDRIQIKFHMHLIKANSRALEARFVLAALDAIKKEDLMKILGVDDVKYWAVDHFIGTGIGAIHSYNLKMLLPSYLRKFFNNSLQTHEKCLIIHLVTQYSNSSNERVTQFLKRKRIDIRFPCSIMNGVMSVVLSTKRNRENEAVERKTKLPVGKTTPRTLELHPFWNIGGRKTYPVTKQMEQIKKKYVHYRKATMVEIVMFVLLGSLSIVVIIFFVTCVLFIVRKRRIRKLLEVTGQQRHPPKTEALQESHSGNTQISAAPLLDGSSGNHIITGVSQGNSDGQCERSILQHEGILMHKKRSEYCERIVNVTLEPLRFSTDDEESRCEEEDSPRFSPNSRIFEPSSIYLGGKRLVPAVRYSKALARKHASSVDSEKIVLEKVPEKGTFEVVPVHERGESQFKEKGDVEVQERCDTRDHADMHAHGTRIVQAHQTSVLHAKEGSNMSENSEVDKQRHSVNGSLDNQQCTASKTLSNGELSQSVLAPDVPRKVQKNVNGEVKIGNNRIKRKRKKKSHPPKNKRPAPKRFAERYNEGNPERWTTTSKKDDNEICSKDSSKHGDESMCLCIPLKSNVGGLQDEVREDEKHELSSSTSCNQTNKRNLESNDLSIVSKSSRFTTL